MSHSDQFSLVPGSRVWARGRAWIVEGHEDLSRLLARCVESNSRDFVAIDELTDPPAVGMSSDDERQDEPASAWVKRLSSRSVRKLTVSKGEAKGTPYLHEREEMEQLDEFFVAIAAAAALKSRSPEKAEAIRAICERFDLSLATVYRNLKILELDGSKEALRRAIRSDRGELRLTDKQTELMSQFVASKRFCPTPSPRRKVLDQINARLKSLAEKTVSESTLARFERRLKSPREVLIAQGRQDKVRDQHRPKVGHLPGATAPLRLVQIDHSPAQVTLVDKTDRLPIGDAFLTLVIDCFSRMILGYCLSFRAPSALNTGIALARSFLPKGPLLDRLKVPGSWPSYGFGQIYQADNAKELNGHMMHSAKRKWRFNLRNRPKGAPNFGGHIESMFSTYMKGLGNTLPGTKFSNPWFRGEYDSEGKAVLTIDDFEACFVDWVVNVYHRSPHEGAGMAKRTPLQVWKSGIFDGDIEPPIGLIPVPRNQEEIRISLLPVDHRTVNQGTVEIFCETYYSVEVEKISANLPSYADPHGKDARLFEIRYDPTNLEFIWIFNRTTGKYIPARVQNERYVGLSLWELREMNRRRGIPNEEDLATRAASQERQDARVEAAAKLTRQARKTREQRDRDVDDRVRRPSRGEGRDRSSIPSEDELKAFLKTTKPRT